MFRKCVFFLILSPLFLSPLAATKKDDKNISKIVIVNRDDILKTLDVVKRMTDYIHKLRDTYKKELSEKEDTLYIQKKSLDQKLGLSLPKSELDQEYLSLEAKIKTLRLKSIEYKDLLIRLEDFVMEKMQSAFKEAINHLQKKMGYHLVLYKSQVAYVDINHIEDITGPVISLMNNSIKIKNFDEIMNDLRKKDSL